MASDDKKTKATPAPKSEPPAKDKSASGADTSKTKSGEATAAPVAAKDGELPAAPPATAGARVKSRFPKLTRITGMRFSQRRRKSDNAPLKPLDLYPLPVEDIGWAQRQILETRKKRGGP